MMNLRGSTTDRWMPHRLILSPIVHLSACRCLNKLDNNVTSAHTMLAQTLVWDLLWLLLHTQAIFFPRLDITRWVRQPSPASQDNPTGAPASFLTGSCSKRLLQLGTCGQNWKKRSNEQTEVQSWQVLAEVFSSFFVFAFFPAITFLKDKSWFLAAPTVWVCFTGYWSQRQSKYWRCRSTNIC